MCSHLRVAYIPYLGYAGHMTTHTSPRIEFVIQCLRDSMPKRWPEIAKKTGVPEDTIRKIAYRDTKDPRSSTLDALHSYFEEESRLTIHHRRATDREAQS